MQANAKMRMPFIKQPGFDESEFRRLRDMERRAASMPSGGGSLYPVGMLDDLMRDAGLKRGRDHAQLQDAVVTMRATIPRRNCAREPPGFERDDPFYHHVPRTNVPTRAVPHTRHEALHFTPHGVYYRQKRPSLQTENVTTPKGLKNNFHDNNFI